MRCGIVSYNKLSSSSTLAHNKITELLGNLCDSSTTFDDEKVFKSSRGDKFDKIFIVNGLECFCEYRELIPELLRNNPQAELYWCSNDYAISPSKKLRELFQSRGVTLLSTVVEDLYRQKWFSSYVYINFNILTYNPSFKFELVDKRDDIIYYGAFRDGRVKYFKKYFASLANIYVSTTSRNFVKFAEVSNGNASLIDKFQFTNSISFGLARFKYTLYIEDEKSHEFYCSPANRFYECLSNGVLMFFDSACINTFKLANIDISQFVVSCPEDVHSKISLLNKDFYRHEMVQRSWVTNSEVESTRNKVLKVVYGDAERKTGKVTYW